MDLSRECMQCLIITREATQLANKRAAHCTVENSYESFSPHYHEGLGGFPSIRSFEMLFSIQITIFESNLTPSRWEGRGSIFD